MTTPIDMGAIYHALIDYGRAAERARDNARGHDAYERAKHTEFLARRAMAEYRKLAEQWPRLRDLQRASERAYDRYATSPPEGCSCHISAPCGFCVGTEAED